MAGESAASAGDSFIGSFISLISKFEIRYEGILYHINVQDSTIGLKKVRSYGTEGRKKDGQQVPPSDKVYEYILFRGSDIKDLQVKSFPPAPKEQIHNDPAIIQTQYSGVPASSSPLTPVGGKNSLTESTQWQDTPALTSRGYPGTLPSNQSVTQQSEHSTVVQTTMYQQGYNGASVGMSHPPHHHINVQPSSVMSNPLTIQPFMQAPEIQASMTLRSVNTSEFSTPVSSSSTSTSVNPKFLPSFSPVQYSASLDVPSSSAQASLPSHSTSLTASTLTTASIPSSRQDLSINEIHIARQAVSDSTTVPPVQSVPCPTSPFMGSNLSPLLTPPPSLLTPDQSAHSGSYMLSSTQKLYPNQKDMGAVAPMQATSSSIPAPFTQAPLLSLPTSTQKAAQFTEEFDFMAMNEKFKKDDLWGYLGKGRQMDKAEGAQDSIAGHRVEEKEGHSSLSNQNPAYNKDEFFDSISCNAQTHGTRNGQNRFSERIKLDTETFGFQQRPNPGYGGYGAGGRGENFRGFHNWGRGYGYGGRGRGGNLPF